MKDKVYLSSGIDALDYLLDMDRGKDGGVLIDDAPENTERAIETPVILIEGVTGGGKTTLSLQYAFTTAHKKDWRVFFISLEQSYQSLSRTVCDFGFDDQGDIAFVDIADAQKPETIRTAKNTVFLCHLSPKPISSKEGIDVFDVRYAELNHLLQTIKEQTRPIGNKYVLLVLDSLSAFSSEPLARDEVYRLFTLFKSFQMTAIVTLENYAEIVTDRMDVISLVSAKYLADIVIKLSRKIKKNYTMSYLEIEKSRQGRQNIGEHLYKIRTANFVEKFEVDKRKGIVVYPSIPNAIVFDDTNYGKRKMQICKEKETLHKVIQQEQISGGDCFALVGPEGTHKLALALNIALACRKPKDPKSMTLIISFGNTGVSNFKGIAWVEELRSYRNLTEGDRGSPHPRYTLKEVQEGGNTIGHIIAFKTGYLAPEECFYIIQDRIRKTKGENRRYSSVLLSDTAELCTGFPLLKDDPVFLPTLIDLFNDQGIVSVCIGVEGEGTIGNKDLNFSLLSKADYRFFLTHYPSMSELAKMLLHAEGGETYKKTEQSVCLIIDNVSGKHYGRKPLWINVHVDLNTGLKTLICDQTQEPL